MTKYHIAENIMSAELDGYQGTLTAKQQRGIFGKALFGKKMVRITCDGQGSVAVRHACWEGTHTSYCWEEYSFETICKQAVVA